MSLFFWIVGLFFVCPIVGQCQNDHASFPALTGQTIPTKSRLVVVEVETKIFTCPPAVLLRWRPQESRTTGRYLIRRRKVDEKVFASDSLTFSVALDKFEHLDTTVEEGVHYEYIVAYVTSVAPSVSMYSAPQGYVRAGIRLPAPLNRGGILLAITKTLHDALGKPEVPSNGTVQQLLTDWRSDGWRVRTLVVDDDDNTVPKVKAKILQITAAAPFINTLLLLGQIAYPYSGNQVPDGHTNNHLGAWPCDSFYGDLEYPDTVWTDVRNLTSVGTNSRLANVAGDGKFDDTLISSDLELAVGRVDLSRLSVVAGKDEAQLTSEYIAKAHTFRFATNRNHTYARDGYLRIGFDVYESGQTPIRFLRPIVGDFQVVGTNLLMSTLMQSNGSVISSGDGPGSYSSVGGVTTSAKVIQENPPVVALPMFGSYFGDTDSSNNVLRTTLTTTHTLLTWWSSWPGWYPHPVAAGTTFGEAFVESQSRASPSSLVAKFPAGGRQNSVASKVYVNLFGDPSLRLFVVPPPRQLRAGSLTCKTTQLQWLGSGIGESTSAVARDVTADNEASLRVVRYDVMRSMGSDAEWSIIGTVAASGTSIANEASKRYTFVDTDASNWMASSGGSVTPTALYAVRAIRLDSTPSATFFNPSHAVWFPTDGQVPTTSGTNVCAQTTTTTSTTTTTITTTSTDTVATAKHTTTNDGAQETATNGLESTAQETATNGLESTASGPTIDTSLFPSDCTADNFVSQCAKHCVDALECECRDGELHVFCPLASNVTPASSLVVSSALAATVMMCTAIKKIL